MNIIFWIITVLWVLGAFLHGIGQGVDNGYTHPLFFAIGYGAVPLVIMLVGRNLVGRIFKKKEGAR